MEQRFMTIKQAKKYTGMGETTLLYVMGLHKYLIQGRPGSPRFLDKEDIDKVLCKKKVSK